MAADPYITAIVSELADYLQIQSKADYPSTSIPKSAFAAWLTEFKDLHQQAPIKLSSVHGDFEGVLVQLLAISSKYGSWNEFSTAGGGRTILEMLAYCTAMLQSSIERSLQENFPSTALSDAAILLSTLRNGVRLVRKRPARVIVSLVNESLEGRTIPAYSQFEIESKLFFNRSPIALPANVRQVFNVELFQGEVKTQTFNSNGEPYQTFELGDKDFRISDTDVLCLVGPGLTPYTRVTDGLMNYVSNSLVFNDSTTQYGNLEVELGNNIHGRMPPNGYVIQIKYALTDGLIGNINRSKLRVSGAGITGETTSVVGAGDDELPINFYRAMGSSVAAARNRAVNQRDYIAHALQFPGVRDAMFLGQRHTPENSNNIYGTNAVQVILLTQTTWAQATWDAFLTYMENLTSENIVFVRSDPTVTTMNIEADIYCNYGVDLEAAKRHLTQKIAEHFAIGRGTLGFSRYTTDILSVLKDETYKVDRVRLISPAYDMEVSQSGWIRLGSVTLNTYYSQRRGSI